MRDRAVLYGRRYDVAVICCRLFNIASVVSLALSMAMTALCFRSWGQYDDYRLTRHGAVPVDSVVSVSYVSLILLSAVLPLIWLMRRLARHTTNSSVCVICGYKLTGNTSGTCPECGTPVPQKPEAVT